MKKLYHQHDGKVAIAEDMGKSWKYGDTVFHPTDHSIKWIGGHASPGPLF